jgi:predicted transcriptional regulator
MAEKLVGDIMHKGVIACKPETLLTEAVRVLADTDVHALVVVDEEGYAVGILAHEHLLPIYGQTLKGRLVAEVMSTTVNVIPPEAPLREAVAYMAEKKLDRLVVIRESPEGKEPMGVLSTTDVIEDMRGPKWVWYMG